MPGKRMLMIADSGSFWTYRLLRYLLLPAGYQVTLFPIWGKNDRYADFYRENGVTLYEDHHRLPMIRHIPKVRMYARILLNAKSLEKSGPFDIVHNHYLSRRDLCLGGLLAGKNKARWVCSFWGSDLMRSSPSELRGMERYLRKCDRITVHNALNVDTLRQTYGPEISAKTKLLYFGQTGYREIDDSRAAYTKKQCREHFGIGADQFVVCVGYSASSAQQQLPVIEAMARMDEDLLRRTTLVLQQTYGENDPDYVRRTHEAARKLPCQTVILRDFMNGEDSAMLRRSADVFVQSILSDAFSASMQEYLYAGAVVIRGAWLVYPQLEEKGISLPAFHTFGEIPALLEAAARDELVPPSEEKRNLVRDENSWDTVREDWLGLYSDP